MVTVIGATLIPTLLPESPASPVPTVVTSAVKPSHLSPSLKLHPDIGIVVIQFWSQGGDLELSIPSQKQINAYTAHPFADLETAESTTA